MGTLPTRDQPSCSQPPLFRATLTWALATLAVTGVLLCLHLASALRSFPWRLASMLSVVAFLAVYFSAEFIRRRGRMSLRMMIALISVVAILCATWGSNVLDVQKRRRQVNIIRAAGGVVQFGSVRDDGMYAAPNPANGKVLSIDDWRVPDQVVAGDSWLLPRWLHDALGQDAWHRPVAVSFPKPAPTEQQLCALDFSGLRYINLWGIPLSDHGFRHLARYSQWHTVIAPYTSATDTSMRYVATFRDLIYLDLSHTNVTDAGLLELQSLHKLRQLNVWGTKVSQSGIRAFHKNVPTCEINHYSGSLPRVYE